MATNRRMTAKSIRLLTTAALVLLLGASVSAQVTLGIKANHLVYDKVRNLLFASVSSDSPLHANRIIAINPNNATVIDYLDVQSEPTILALSDSCGTLLANLHETGEVLRLNPANLNQVGSFVIGVFGGETHTAYDIDFSPGSEVRIVLKRGAVQSEFSNDRLVVYENWEPLPNSLADLDAYATFSSSPSLLYGQESSSAGTLYIFTTDANGFTSANGRRGLTGGNARCITSHASLVYMEGGRVVDPQEVKLNGTFPDRFPGGRSFTIDPLNRVALFGATSGLGFKLQIFHMDKFRLLGEIDLEVGSDPVRIVRWGAAGVAVATEEAELRILRSALVWAAEPVRPETLSIVRGSLTEGNLASIQESDDKRLSLRPGVTFTSIQAPVELIVSAHLESAIITGLAFTVKGRATSSSIARKVEFYNFVTASYEQIDVRPSTTVESETTVDVEANAERFIEPSTKEVRARITYKATGPVFSYPWSSSIEHVYWNAGK